MVSGFEKFKEQFKGYEDCYTIIGGTACDILMSDAASDFRLTKDIDMILLIENRFEEFAKVFWEFIKAGNYKCGWRNSEIPHFYRFTEPLPGYPVMIELFSKRPDFQLNHTDIYLTPLPVSEDISSLSAIMLDGNYYNLIRLKDVRVLRESGRLNKEDVKELEKAIAARSVQFLVDNEEEIHVRLTDIGIRKYRQQLYLRPSKDSVLCDGHTYVFHCTQFQVEVYFLKFGKEAQILKPQSLRERFQRMYAEALESYQ